MIPSFLFVLDAEIVTIGALMVSGTLPMEICLSVECLGCDVNDTSVYDIPDIDNINLVGSRMLLEENDMSILPNHRNDNSGLFERKA